MPVWSANPVANRATFQPSAVGDCMGLHGIAWLPFGVIPFLEDGSVRDRDAVAVAVAWLGGVGFGRGIGSIGVGHWAGWGRVGIAG